MRKRIRFMRTRVVNGDNGQVVVLADLKASVSHKLHCVHNWALRSREHS